MEIIDVWAQHPTRRFIEQPFLATLARWTGQDFAATEFPYELTASAMTDGGVSRALLSAWEGPQGSLVANDEVAEAIDGLAGAERPGAYRGLASVDIRNPVAAVREIRRCVDELGFVGVRIVPWLWNLPPNDRRFYPVYVACVELGVPLCTQIGHTGPLCPSEPGRPIPYLDEVLLDFPDLVVVGGHVGYPWIDEVLSLAHKYPNFYVDTSAYAVHRLPAALVEYMRGSGRSRVMFGTNWPMMTPARALARFDELGLDDEAAALFLGGNAARVFGL
ncbi:putative hydrolase [Gordonia araii NBRC 100433]|uniref:Putative hydrolase n=1 Tax=Gordonia araii NBRC 100433 TaxID=1073574 RepID=G7H645_9ACTN|nr:amidohydrolase family protein [Gordonia araii]NNG98718.1 amidohydrolase [Gordonia araii NBRC 100433]GAB11284.1 putative hydrolase [Gordonia araii NBRC 100433]